MCTEAKALGMYRGVMRPYPHPRSAEAIEGLAAYRGSQSACTYAEAFELVMRRGEESQSVKNRYLSKEVFVFRHIET